MSLAENGYHHICSQVAVQEVLSVSRITPLLAPYDRRIYCQELVRCVDEVIEQTHGRLNQWIFEPGDDLGQEVIEMLRDWGISVQGSRSAVRKSIKTSIEMMIRGKNSIDELRNYRRNMRRAKILPFESQKGGEQHSGPIAVVKSDVNVVKISDYHTANI